MDKPIFTEEQARELYVKAVSDSDSLCNDFIIRLKHYGYIKKSALEKAKEKFESYWKDNSISSIILSYIQELEFEIERLKTGE